VAPEDRTPHLRGARPHDGARTVDVHTCPLSRDRLHRLRREELQQAEAVGMRQYGSGRYGGLEVAESLFLIVAPFKGNPC